MANPVGESLLPSCKESIPSALAEKLTEYRVEKDGTTIEVTVSSGNGSAIFTLRDVTKSSRRMELAKRREAYAAMGELAADIAHEIRNPLGSIELFASLLKRGLKRDTDIRRIDQIISAVKVVNSKISRLLLSSQIWESSRDDVNIHDILKDILLYSEQVIDRNTIYLSLRLADMEPMIDGNPDMLRQIFLGLILIALQSLPEASRLEIKTVYIPERSSIEVQFHTASQDFLDRVCGKDASAGMGLAIMHHIMNLHNGSVRIEQFTEETTAFVLAFPLVAGNDVGSMKGSA